MKIAIVGSGITGLAAGWLLTKAGHQVSLFEKQDFLGMDAHSVTLPHQFQSEVPAGLDPHRIDVPPRLFNRQLWPNVVHLYNQAGIETCPIDPTKTFSDATDRAYLARLTGYRPALVDFLRSDIRQIAIDAGNLLDRARKWNDSSDWPDLNLKQFWATNNYSDAFIFQFLYPALSSTVCTCDYQTLDDYPVEIIFSALLSMVDGDPLSRTRWGSQDVVQRLSQAIDRIQLNSIVQDAMFDSDSQQVQIRVNESRQSYDHLIIATQANHVASIASQLSSAEAKVLNSFRYVSAPVVVHTDQSLMPSDPNYWSHFNMQTRSSSDSVSSTAQCTMWINRFRDDGLHKANLFQTIMPYRQPESSHILSRGNLQRPAVTRESFQRWRELESLLDQPNRRIWFCGSYAVKGIPLLESGVRSAMDTVERILQPSSVS